MYFLIEKYKFVFFDGKKLEICIFWSKNTNLYFLMEKSRNLYFLTEKYKFVFFDGKNLKFVFFDRICKIFIFCMFLYLKENFQSQNLVKYFSYLWYFATLVKVILKIRFFWNRVFPDSFGIWSRFLKTFEFLNNFKYFFFVINFQKKFKKNIKI